uniref:NADH-ubiquinone oxidoreductase chain 5 n=1 Tax=Gryllotalpa orientalis TaxID=213494 RepID=Q5ISE9_GRYOR|nr:NADH dehydrogenase subunit 5 [Gryllotalpa orientalis]AAT64926.2 NADH dehydrogenase subunit 5 [Gryllotalpa orientalis]
MWRYSVCKISFAFLFSLSLLLIMYGIFFLKSDYSLIVDWEIIEINSVMVVMTLLFDWMSLMFMGFVMLISSLVIKYSEEYMEGDLNIYRFILLVLLFVLSMMFLIISPNLISILLGWDGLGLVSYCLVIYYQNSKSFNAGMLTALSNRVGDVALLMSIAWFFNFGSWNYVYWIWLGKSFELNIVGGLILLAAMTKSAQIPFSSWLPAAMAAPTPVSALVHSSTLVTAGVYLLVRFNNLIGMTFWCQLLLLLGGMTMFMAGMGANFEFDLKSIIAPSTLSQLGLMMSILAMGLPELAFFHLLTHALFKALLFMCAGVIIHVMGNSQDIRGMGGIITMLPLTSSCFHVSNMALCGMPFLAGFYSKDLILEMASLSNLNLVSFIFYFFSTGLTVSYSLRLVYYSMVGDNMGMSYSSVSDSGWIMYSGMIPLVFMSIFGGSLLMWMMFPSPSMICLPLYLKFLTLFVMLVGGFVGYEISKMKLLLALCSLKSYEMVMFLGSMWNMPYLSTQFVSFLPLELGGMLLKNYDHGWSEDFGGQNIYKSMKYYSVLIQWIQENSIKIYLVSFMVWLMILFMLF